MLKALFDLIPKIPKHRRYWFVRTNAGAYYDDFISGNFIGVGWNNITLDTLEDNIPLCDKVLEKYPKERKNYVARQINIIIDEMKKGDVVLIPSYNSTYIHFGIIEDEMVYEEEIPNEIEDLENNSHLTFNYEGICPYKKRRKVNWIKERKKEMLDPQLYRIIYSQQTISNVDKYADFIDKALYDFFIKNDVCHLILHVRKKGDIKGSHLVTFMSDLLSLTELNKMDDEEVNLKVAVQSPGTIELLGAVPVIVLSTFVLIGILGGKAKFLGAEINTPGVLGRILEFKKNKQIQNLLKKIDNEQEARVGENADNLNVHLPQSLETIMRQLEQSNTSGTNNDQP
ncbi:hypothetical protein RUL31_07700 [Bacillus atrophaeus]|uniref:hypothetical protein n=1 Tax=Bacillus atrophaeus TaxID=1452 RepID=UPI0028F70AF6|nr:hypothetical protein [Bacillus atrophaeus]WNV81146.1 hypothetical protein RUL31_07700 [Bacillus atrophaeus]